MRNDLYQITCLAGQALAQYPGGKRRAFSAMRALTGATSADPTLYAQFNANESSGKALTLGNFLAAMKVTCDHMALHYQAGMFGYGLTSLEAAEPDAPTVEAEMLQDYPRLVDFHKGCVAFAKGEMGFIQLDVLKEALMTEIRETVERAIRERGGKG